MSILDDILNAMGLGKKPAAAPAPRSPTSTAPRAPAPPPAQPAAATLQLAALKAQNTAPVGSMEIDAAAARLGIQAEAMIAIVQVESAGKGFGPDGRPLILFEPSEFSELTNRRFDASHPKVSKPNAVGADLGATQADRWAKLTEAYALDQTAALKATSWGLFQMSGEHFAACGFPNVFAMVTDVSKTESRQLAHFEAFVKSKGLAPTLNARDWTGFARVFGGHATPEKLGQLIAAAYQGGGAAPAPAPSGGDFLASLRARNAAPLSNEEIVAAARRMGCEPASVRAVLKVESKGNGFGADGRPLILYEPHVFSKLTNHLFDQSNPTVSYLNWKTLPYPKTQAERYQQLAQAYTLNPEAAVSAASWGLFQILGSNYKACGFSSAKAFVADIAQSEARMLTAFEAFVRSNNILVPLQRKLWGDFARVYNGPGQVDTYSRLLADAYADAAAQV